MGSDPADKVQATFGSRVLSGCQNLVASFTEETTQATLKLSWELDGKTGVLVIFSSQLEDGSAEALWKEWVN